MSWVTLDRICEEQMRSDAKIRRLLEDSGRPLRSHAAQMSDGQLLERLRGFGFDLDRAGIEWLCEGALSAQEVADGLLDRCDLRSVEERIEGDWIWICVISLWQRWWPEKVCLELLDDRVQSGYRALERGDTAAAAATWLRAWSDVVGLCTITGIGSIDAFDERFPMTQSLFNWSQDLEDALWNAGLDDPDVLRARVAVCEDALRRFPDEERLMVENRRRALAESYFELGEKDRAEALFDQWLAEDPRWGWGWIGWADLYFFMHSRPKDYPKAEELLRRGYSTPGVRDHEEIAQRLARLYEETGRGGQAREVAPDAKRHRPASSGLSVRRTIELVEEPERAVGHDRTTVTFEDEGLPLDRLEEIVGALQAPRRPTPRAAKVGRNSPCPCGSGRKFKKCCGSDKPPGG
ncbi:MAG: SEC-C metal-binding domain-containing protein [Actinomycetota bacterium]|nr:SEC-C metal-binding domain-containing protein [Actinomycetota bacterium]